MHKMALAYTARLNELWRLQVKENDSGAWRAVLYRRSSEAASNFPLGTYPDLNTAKEQSLSKAIVFIQRAFDEDLSGRQVTWEPAVIVGQPRTTKSVETLQHSLLKFPTLRTSGWTQN